MHRHLVPEFFRCMKSKTMELTSEEITQTMERQRKATKTKVDGMSKSQTVDMVEGVRSQLSWKILIATSVLYAIPSVQLTFKGLQQLW